MKKSGKCLLMMSLILILAPIAWSESAPEPTSIPGESLNESLPFFETLSEEVKTILVEYGKEVAKEVTAILQPQIDEAVYETKQWKSSFLDKEIELINKTSEFERDMKRLKLKSDLSLGFGLGLGAIGIVLTIASILKLTQGD